MNHLHCTTLLWLTLASVPAFGQAAVPPPEPNSQPFPAAEAGAQTSSVEEPRAEPASPPPTVQFNQPQQSTEPTPPGQIQFGTSPHPGSEQPEYVTQVAPQRSPREALYFGFGLGGGRMQDKVMGYGGVAFNLGAGYSINRTVSLALELGGMGHKEGDTNIGLLGIAFGPQIHLLEHIKLAAGVGYYGLSHNGPLKAPNEKADDPDEETLTSVGAEATLGVEVYQAPGGFTLGIDARTQLAFPDQKLVLNTFGLVVLRWYGIGRRRG